MSKSLEISLIHLLTFDASDDIVDGEIKPPSPELLFGEIFMFD